MADEVARITGRGVAETRRLSGGDTAAAFAVRLDDGTEVFAKSTSPSMPGAAAAEAASLRWLAEPGVVAVPEVFGEGENCLVTEHVATAPPSARAAEELGRGLARLHAAGAPAFGSPPPGGPADAWIGLAPMRNEPEEDWPAFYARHRVQPYVHRGVDEGVLSAESAKVLDQVCESLAELAGPAEPPARLHGDLWSGNVHWGRDRAWLIDPAAHGGHRETDLAMLHLFGSPQLDRIVEAYSEVHPLAEGWRDRIALHQLFPLLVHAVLFGGGYAVQAVQAARRALASH
ncbi:fructosamine kinase family protein [Saccharopolyspora mangrovi]|uniref:Fructosamine kinase family protein n=1 Tax=Saccharopolyspora mangrovi TaxID=3082379 RepID=A0ABU6A8L0_9PSEU|nr:fructosamine kinase family protein [Saccharopolyspora sp. S2-29]MEB3367811.1 fructosamine kinase family protein [Saccharopolyspora sp. S2-29]